MYVPPRVASISSILFMVYSKFASVIGINVLYISYDLVPNLMMLNSDPIGKLLRNRINAFLADSIKEPAIDPLQSKMNT